jgi:RNA polymerase sigma-70 factor (ECF subfamily)
MFWTDPNPMEVLVFAMCRTVESVEGKLGFECEMDTSGTAQKLPGLEALKEGDSSAWEAFFKEHDHIILSVVAWSKWHFAVHIREEIAQQIRVELTRAVPGFRGESSLTQFVKKIGIRRCIDQVRRETRARNFLVPDTVRTEDGEFRHLDFEAGEEFDPRESVQKTERAAALRELLEDLDPACKTAIRQFYMEEKTYKEIAELNGITVNTVGSRLSKCLEKLRFLMKEASSFEE